MNNQKICLITFSNNIDHQDVIYSMFHAIEKNTDAYTVGISNPKSIYAPNTEKNLYINGPLRPGIEAKTFRIDLLFKVASFIRKNKIKYIFFESQHIWNIPIMLLCHKCICVQAVHDVIPHDGNRAMDISNYFTSHLSNHIILRNHMYKPELSCRYNIHESKITCFEPWRPYPEEKTASKKRVFLFFGRIRKYKGFELLVKIVQKCPDITFKVVGEPDNESRSLVEELKDYNNVEVIDKEVSCSEMIDFFKATPHNREIEKRSHAKKRMVV